MQKRALTIVLILIVACAAVTLCNDKKNNILNYACIIKTPDVSRDKKKVVVVCPHPDDEYQGWAAIGSDETPVFVVLTLGEKSKICNKLYGSKCSAKRVEATTDFLSKMLDRPYGFIIMDNGDAKLTTGKLEKSLSPLLKKLNPDKRIVAAYYNEEAGCTPYKHSDHKALNDFMKSQEWNVPVYLRVGSCSAIKRVTLFIDEKVHTGTWGAGGFGQIGRAHV